MEGGGLVWDEEAGQPCEVEFQHTLAWSALHSFITDSSRPSPRYRCFAGHGMISLVVSPLSSASGVDVDLACGQQRILSNCHAARSEVENGRRC
jgi:hypothetical protein